MTTLSAIFAYYPATYRLHVTKTATVFCTVVTTDLHEGWNFNSGNYLFTTDTK